MESSQPERDWYTSTCPKCSECIRTGRFAVCADAGYQLSYGSCLRMGATRQVSGSSPTNTITTPEPARS